MATRVLEVHLTGDSVALERAFGRAEKAGAAAATSLEAAGMRMQQAGAKMTSTGRTLTRSVSLPIAAVGAASAKFAIDFEKSMRNVNSIAGLPEKKFQRLNKEVLAMAGPTAQAPRTLAEGLYDLVSSGFKAKESMTVLKASAKAASAGLTTTEVSTKAVAAALNAYHRPARDAGKVSDDLFQTVNLGVVSFEELAGSIGYVLPAAATMGINIKEVGASISTLTKEGQSGETAITNINQAITSFIKPSKEMKAALKELGYESGQQIIHQKGFQGALETVTGAADGNREAVGKMFSNVRAMRAVFGLTGKSAKAAAEDLRGFQHDAGATNKVLKEQEKSLSFQWSRLRSELEVDAIAFGKRLIPALRGLIGPVKSVAQWFSRLPESTQNTVVKVGLVAVALGPVLTITGKLLSGWGKLLTIIGKVGRWLEIIQVANAAGGRGGVVAAGVGGASAGRATSTVAQSAGAYGEKQALRDVGLIGGGTAAGSLKGRLAGAAKSLGRTVLGLAGGYILTEVGVHGLKAFGVGDPTEGQGTLKSLTHGFNTSGVAKTEKEALSAYSRQEKTFENAMLAIQLHQLAGLGRMKVDLRHGLAALTGEWATNKVAWREQTTEAMQQTIAAIRGGMHAGVIPVKQGKGEIQHLLSEIKVVKGSDPLGLAGSYTAAFKKAGGVTQSGINSLLRDFRRMPKGAREAAQDAVLGQLSAWAKGHPKIEAQVDILRKNILHKFGQTNTQTSRGVRALVDTVGGLFSSMAEAVTGSINIMGVNVSGILKQLGITKAVNFTVNVAKAGAKAVKGVVGMLPGQAQGGAVRVPGQGLADTVPLAVNGAMSAVVAPGEDLVVLNRHQRPLVDRALANEYGVAGLPGFFSTFDHPHYMAKGGQLAHPEIAGGTAPMRHMGQAMVDRVYRAEEAYIKAHRPKPGVGGVAGYTGPPASMRQLGDPRWVDAHTLAVTAFLDRKFGLTMSSGYRSPQHNAEIGGAPGSLHTHGSSSNPGATDSVGSMGAMQAYIGFAKQHVAGIEEAMVDNYAGLGYNAHLGFFAKGGAVSGKVTWFNGGATAGGSNTSRPGLALNLDPGSDSGWDNETTQGWMEASRAGHPVYARVAIGGKSANLPITDLGPAGWTGNAIDVTEGGVRKLGFTTDNFPSGTVGKAVVLGGGAASEAAKKFKPKFGLQGQTTVEYPALGPTPLLPSAKALPPTIKGLLRSPGLDYAGKVGISEMALQQAEATPGFLDDEKVLAFQEELFKRNKKRLQRQLSQVEKELHKRQTTAQRQRSLAQRSHLLEELGGTESALAGVRDSEAKPTAKDRVDLELARAESTSGKEDDIEALRHLEDLAKKELERAEKSGDPREIAEATRNLKEAADALREAQPTAEDFASRDLALAELTESTEDDKAALHELLRIAEDQLNVALSTPDPRDDIEAAHKVKEIRDSLKAIEENTSQAQLAEEMKALREEMEKSRHVAESEAATSAAVARRALTDMIAEQLGGRVTHRRTAGDGGIGTLARI
jgi:TP901 family phage tail tape measure protein